MREGAAVILLLLVGCARPVSPKPPEVLDSDLCDDACSRLTELSCPESRPVMTGASCKTDLSCEPGQLCIEGSCGASCEQFCRETQAQGVWLQPACVMKLDSCEHIEWCAVEKTRD